MNYLGQSLVASRSVGGISGPTTSTLNAVPRFADETGDALKDSAVLVSDTGAITGSTSITANAITAPSGTLNINAGSFYVTTTAPTGIYMSSVSSHLRGAVNGAARISAGPDGATGVEARGIDINIGAPGNITAECDGVFSLTALQAGGAGNAIELNGNTKITGTVEVTGSTTAGSFVKMGGTPFHYLMADGSVLSQSASSGNSNFYLYKSHTNTPTPPPTGGFVYYNNAIQKNATIIYISHLTDDNIDIEIFFQNLSTLNEVYIQQKTVSENYIKYNITANPTVVTGSHIAIPVAQISFGGSGETSFGANEPILVSFFTNSLEVDTRLSNLETKTQNQSVVPGTTNFLGTTAFNAGFYDQQIKFRFNTAINNIDSLMSGGTGFANLHINALKIITSVVQLNSIAAGGGNQITIEGNLDMSQNLIRDLGNPIDDYDAANKGYVDSPSAFTIPNLSNANIYALSATNGRTAYNTDSNSINVYIGGAWGNFLATKRTITLLRVVPMTSNNTPAPFVASASTIWDPSYEPFKAFDNNITSEWFSGQAPLYNLSTPGTYSGAVSTTVSGAPVLGEWIQLAFTSVIVHSYTITVNTTYRNNAAPTSWVVAGSSNGGSTWTTLDTKTRVWTGNTSQSYNLSAPLEINAIRFIVREIYNFSGLVRYATVSEFIINKLADVVDDNINISSTKTFTPPKLSTPERNLLIPVEGNVIYNTTTKVLNTYNGTAWV